MESRERISVKAEIVKSPSLEDQEVRIEEVANKRTLMCLCITACFLSAPLNGLSPALSMAAHDMGFTDKERDIYLGSYQWSPLLGRFLDKFIRKLSLALSIHL
jgi:hypothetical protein